MKRNARNTLRAELLAPLFDCQCFHSLAPLFCSKSPHQSSSCVTGHRFAVDNRSPVFLTASGACRRHWPKASVGVLLRFQNAQNMQVSKRSAIDGLCAGQRKREVAEFLADGDRHAIDADGRSNRQDGENGKDRTLR